MKMRSRILGSCVVVVWALGALPAGAWAAKPKPKLWLTNGIAHARATPGEAARLYMAVEECNMQQSASLVDNGEPIDHFLGGSSPEVACPAAFKLAGNVTRVAVAPSTPPAFAMTVTSVMHVHVEPWCVYTLPSKFTLPARYATESGGAIKSALDKPASFGSCAATRQVYVGLAVVQVNSGSVYEGEIVG
jgi:hypothetical protein